MQVVAMLDGIKMQSLRDGSRDGYRWLWSADAILLDVLTAVPELAIGHFVAITSFDSGTYRPSAAQRAAGWRVKGEVSFTPRISDLQMLPRAGWDEWYVVSEQDLPVAPQVFVNRSDFSPMPDESLDPALLTHCLARANGFWQELLLVRPLAFIADNEAGLSLVISDQALFARALVAVRGSA
jgi:hypothetical protein